MTIAEELAQWANSLSFVDIPKAVRHAARRHVLDGVGVALGALAEDNPAVAVARGLGGPPEATLFGSRDRIGAPAAALATGALVHALDFDDTHAEGLVHATAATLPAALAVAEQVEASGAQFLAAAIIGYEVTCRVASATPYGFHERGIHATHAAGVIGAAAIAARLMGLDAGLTAQAMGIAGSSSGGLLEFLHTGSSTKQLHPGLAGHAGIVAARLAAAGATGPVSVLEGGYGVWAALSARPADPARVLRGLGEVWEVTRITVKPYPACQLSHAALDATAAVLATVDGAEIEEVVVDVHPDSAAIVCEPAADKVRPRTPYDAKFSLPWSIAAMLLDGGVSVATYTPESVARSRVAALAGRVRTVVVDSGPVAAEAPGRTVVRLRDGRELIGEVARSRGGPEAPLSDDALLAKLLLLAGDTPAVRELAATDIESHEHISTFTDLIARAA